jgi:hypothetical protein
MPAAEQGRLPQKLQDLVKQVAKRRDRFGNRQTVVIDIRGQLTIHGADPARAAQHRSKVQLFGRVVSDATGLPIEQIQILTW